MTTRLKLTILLAALLLGSNGALGMKRAGNLMQRAIDGVANSSAWGGICSYLLRLGQEVHECECYKGHTFDDSPMRIPAHQLHRLEDGARHKLIFLAGLQLFGAVLSGSAALYEDDQKAAELQRVCFSSENNTPICCSLQENLALNCCLTNEPFTCIAFNPLDNTNAQFNCCEINQSGQMSCSKAACLNLDSIKAPCDLFRAEQEFSDDTSKQGQALVDAIEESYYEHGFLIEKKGFKFKRADFEIPPMLEDIPECLQHIISHIQRMEQSFNIHPDFKVRLIRIGTGRHKTNSARITCEKHKVTIFLGREFDADWLDLSFVVGHEIAHSNQAQMLANQGHWSELRPGFEISADILGSIASNYRDLSTYGAKFFNSGDWEWDKKGAPFCKKNLAAIDRHNVFIIENLLKTENEDIPHPKDEVRGIILLQLSTMIKAAVKYLEA